MYFSQKHGATLANTDDISYMGLSMPSFVSAWVWWSNSNTTLYPVHCLVSQLEPVLVAVAETTHGDSIELQHLNIFFKGTSHQTLKKRSWEQSNITRGIGTARSHTSFWNSHGCMRITHTTHTYTTVFSGLGRVGNIRWRPVSCRRDVWHVLSHVQIAVHVTGHVAK